MPMVMATVHTLASEAMAAKPSRLRFGLNERAMPSSGSSATMSQHTADVTQYMPSSGMDESTRVFSGSSKNNRRNGSPTME